MNESWKWNKPDGICSEPIIGDNRAVVDGFERRIGVIDEVVECHLVTGKSDYLLRVMVADLAAYEDFVRNRLHDIEGITSIESIFVYSSVKDAGAWPDPGS